MDSETLRKELAGLRDKLQREGLSDDAGLINEAIIKIKDSEDEILKYYTENRARAEAKKKNERNNS